MLIKETPGSQDPQIDISRTMIRGSDQRQIHVDSRALAEC